MRSSPPAIAPRTTADGAQAPSEIVVCRCRSSLTRPYSTSSAKTIAEAGTSAGAPRRVLGEKGDDVSLHLHHTTGHMEGGASPPGVSHVQLTAPEKCEHRRMTREDTHLAVPRRATTADASPSKTFARQTLRER